MFEAFMVLIIVVVALAVWASWRVFDDKLASPAQRWAQFAFVWFVPIVGPMIAIHLKRREPERGSGTYREIPDPGDDFGYSGRAGRPAVNDAEAPSHHGEPAQD